MIEEKIPKGTVHLGLIKAIHSGLNPPLNKKLIWFDEIEKIHKTFNVVSQEWKPLGNNNNPTDIGGGLTEEFIVSKGAGSYSPGQTFPGGLNIAEAFRSLLTSTSLATFSSPSLEISLNINGLREVGEVVGSLIIKSLFNRGRINGGYDGVVWNPGKNMGPAVGLPTKHTIGTDVFNTSSVEQTKTINNYIIPLGSTVFSGNVDYLAGTKPVNSEGDEQPAHEGGNKSAQVVLESIVPYFYGVINENQTIDNIDINSLTKVIGISTGSVSIRYNAVVGKRLVILIPSSSTLKSKWFVNALNNGTIGGNGDLFSVSNKSYSSPSSLWGSTSFRVYLSTPTSINETIQLQN